MLNDTKQSYEIWTIYIFKINYYHIGLGEELKPIRHIGRVNF